MSKALRKSKKIAMPGLSVFSVVHDVLNQSHIFTYETTFDVTRLIWVYDPWEHFFQSFRDSFGQNFVINVK